MVLWSTPPAVYLLRWDNPTGGGPLGTVMRFLDDIRQLKAHAVLMLGIVCFAVLVTYYSGQMLMSKDEHGKAVRSNSIRASGVGQSMSGMLSTAALKVHEDMQNQLLKDKQAEAAAAMARRALADETLARNAHRVTGIIVFKEHGTNLNLALRSVGRRSFIREVLLVHDLGAISNSMPKEWSEPPNNIFGKPVKYLPRRGDRNELLKFDACASDADPRNDVCYYQSWSRDSSRYLDSLWASFLRAPHLLHTSVGATTLYNDLQLTFREDAFGIYIYMYMYIYVYIDMYMYLYTYIHT